MADARMPAEFFEVVSHHLPPDEPVGPEGGRPRVTNLTVLKVLWYVLVTGCRWRDVPLEMGCCGETARTRLREWEQAGLWGRIHLDLLRLLRRDGGLEHDTVIVDSVLVRAHGGGDKTGPNPVDRRKPGTKYTLAVDRQGAALAIRIEGAQASDHTQLLPLVAQEFPKVTGAPGRPREKPEELYADAGYDSDAARSLLRGLGIEPHIRRRGATHGSGLGKIRWVVERTIAWVKGLRRMRVRYDRNGDIIEGWKSLTLSVINFRLWQYATTLAT